MKENGSHALSARERFLRKVPVELYPPYGYERDVFRGFLEGLPEGGIGFHATTTKHLESIQKYGLKPGMSYRSRPEVHYEFLNPATDPVLNVCSRVAGEIATYYRLKNSITAIMEDYGVGRSFLLNEKEEPTIPYQPMLVVFENAELFNTVMRKKDAADLDSIKAGVWFVEEPVKRRKRIAQQGVKNRSFVIQEKLGGGYPRPLQTLEWGQGEKVPADNISDIHVMWHSDLADFTDFAIREIVSKYSLITR